MQKVHKNRNKTAKNSHLHLLYDTFQFRVIYIGMQVFWNQTSIWFVKRVKVSRLVENLLKLSRVLGTFCPQNLSLTCLWSLEREFEMSLDEKEFWHKCLPPFQIYFVEKWNPTVTLIHKDGKIVDYSAMILRHFTLQGIDDWSV